MRRRMLSLASVLGVVLTATLPSGAPAQPHLPPGPTHTERGSWTAVRIAKWALLGAAVGFGTYALTNSRQGDAAYDDLRAICQADQSRCVTTAGRYTDAQAERLYRQALAADRRAQVGIIGGQITLLGSAALFVYDLRNGRGPTDIPYPSSARRRGGGLLVGARLAF